MGDLYIGNRLTVSEMSKVLSKNARYINSKLSDTLRSIALRKGIAKTQKGSKLMFYRVDEDEYEQLINDSTKSIIALKHGISWLPLIAIKESELNEAIQRVNSKFSQKMDYKTHRIYLEELRGAMDNAVIKLNDDKKFNRKKAKESKGNVNDLRVGDVTLVREDKYYRPKLARITKVSDKSFWCEFILPNGKVVSNLDYALLFFKEVRVISQSKYGSEFVIPYKVNSELFQVQLDYNGKPRTAMRRWNGENLAEGYHMDANSSD